MVAIYPFRPVNKHPGSNFQRLTVEDPLREEGVCLESLREGTERLGDPDVFRIREKISREIEETERSLKAGKAR